jgi:hypothetical protein
VGHIQQHRHAVAEVVPVEEAPAACVLHGPRLVKLVRVERHHTGVVPAGGDYIEE